MGECLFVFSLSYIFFVFFFFFFFFFFITLYLQIQKQVQLDLSTWHTMGVEWTSTKVTYTIDGLVFGSAAAGEQGAVIPSGDMK